MKLFCYGSKYGNLVKYFDSSCMNLTKYMQECMCAMFISTHGDCSCRHYICMQHAAHAVHIKARLACFAPLCILSIPVIGALPFCSP